MPSPRKYPGVMPENVPLLESVLSSPAPFPMVVVEGGSHWVDPGHQDTLPEEGDQPMSKVETKFEIDDSARSYRAHFLGYDHQNFSAVDDDHGPVILSVKHYSDKEENHIRVILRTMYGTVHRLIPNNDSDESPSPLQLSRLLCEDLSVDKVEPILSPRASELIVNYDEHVVVNNYKFGIVYQKFGQITEEALFGNRRHSQAMDEFLDMLGQRIDLNQHEGYKGGLDTVHGQTGQYSVYQVFHNREIMFHISTLLPYSEVDKQQLQRKRHIGNDIVAVVFQENNTPFSPNIIASNFLHAYIIVQPINNGAGNTSYRVSVTARTDVPYFGPNLPSPAIFEKGTEFKEFLLTKLINAENACYKAEKFSTLERRTRSCLLSNLTEQLSQLTTEYLNGEVTNKAEKSEFSSQNGILNSVKKALISRTKSYAPQPKMKKSSRSLLSSQALTENIRVLSNNENDCISCNSEFSMGMAEPETELGNHSCSQAKFDSGRGSDGSTGSHGDPDSPGRSSSLSSQIYSASSPDRQQTALLDTSDDSSINSLEIDTLGYIMKPNIKTYNDNNNNNQNINNQNNKCHIQITGNPQPNQPEVKSNNQLLLDPRCQEVVSGHVTMVTVEGGAVASQLEKLQADITRLKVEKLELLRQNVSAQREVKHLRERELQLQSDLSTASREINKLRTGLKQRLVRELPWPEMRQDRTEVRQDKEEQEETWEI